jgi:hypothetical protein
MPSSGILRCVALASIIKLRVIGEEGITLSVTATNARCEEILKDLYLVLNL